MSDDEMGSDHVYQIIVTMDIRTSHIQVSCGGLGPQLVRVALELAADYLDDVSGWAIVAENAGSILTPTPVDVDTDDD
jgi:hypothetical protein